MNKENIYIWGTGKIAETAYQYYKDKVTIIGFIDNNRTRCDTLFHGKTVYEPQILENNNTTIVLALKKGVEEAIKKLHSLGVDDYVLFEMKEERKSIKESTSVAITNDDIIVRFSGGLGNQMFQYAIYRYYQTRNKVYADLSYYKKFGVMPFVIDKVFPGVEVNECNNEDVMSMLADLLQKNKTGNFDIYVEKDLYKIEKRCWDKRLLDQKSAYLSGSFQYYQIAENIRDALKIEFSFKKIKNKKISELAAYIRRMPNSVSVHIRRGDYLDDRNKTYYMNICTEQYYKNAEKYFNMRFKECHFFYFSDDIEWLYSIVGNNSNVTVVDIRYAENYEDWYDMYLMSLCNHNVIANSTFSWWAAWLNENNNKVVVAPKRWINGCECTDVYPPDWILIDSI